MQYGILLYDVPLARKSVYNKLRSKISRLSIQLTWSAYLIPLGDRDRILSILKELDDDENQKQRILYRVLPFDPVAGEELEQLVKDEFQKNLRKVKESLSEKIAKVEEEFATEELNLDEWASLRRQALTKSKKKILDARRLAAVFDMTGFMDAAYSSFEALIEARREEVRGKLKERTEERKAEREKEKAKERLRKAEEKLAAAKEKAGEDAPTHVDAEEVEEEVSA
jgi:hypothetical protein